MGVVDLLRPIEGGTYTVNDAMIEDLKKGYSGQHASNLGGIFANEIATGLNIPAFIVDPVVVDEMAADCSNIWIFLILNENLFSMH